MGTEFIFVLIIVFFILISAFFSGSETALMSSSKPKLHSLEKENRRAKKVNKLLKNPADLLSTILLGNNLVNIAASALATVVFTNLFGAAGVIYATVVMTLIVLIFAEVLPKTIASIAPEKFAMSIVNLMLVISKVLRPFTKAISFVTSKAISLLGIKTKDSSNFFNEDDLKGAISLGLTTGILEDGEHRMLDSIVKLDNICAEEIMQHRSKIESLSIKTSNDDIFDMVKNSSHSRIPVYNETPEDIVGILYLKDFLPAYALSVKTGNPFRLQEILKEAIFVPESATASNLLIELRNTRSHMRFVVNEYGDLQGLLTLEDILEEIVGEIEDEHDYLEKKFSRQKDGSLIISGFYSIRDCNREFKFDIPEDDNITIGGFVNSLAESPSKEGDILKYKDLVFEILRHNNKAILKLKIHKNKTQEA